MAGRIRVLVATSAFGMGLNKEDLQAVIHYSLTKSFENYIQEIGRVGRTQQTSFCHAFLPPSLINDPCEANELRRHIFVNHIDRILLKRFLGFLFGGIKCICREGSCNGHVRVVDPIEMSEKLDLKVESLATLLAFLELDPSGPLISSLQPGYAVATIDCYGGPGELAYASERCLAVAAALGLEAKKHGADSVRKARQLSIDLSALCNRWGWHPGKMRQELKGLEWNSSGQRVARTGINVVMSKWSWWLWIHGPQIPVSNDRLDKCLDYLANRLASVEAAGLDSLECLTQVLATVAKDRVDQVYPPHSSDGQASEITIEREKCSRSAHELIESYFMETSSSQIRKNMDKNEFHWPTPVPESLVNAVRKTIREFISIHGPSQGEKLSGRNVANILHGISTPQYPSFVWSRVHRFWRAHLNADWPCIKRLATEELLQRL